MIKGNQTGAAVKQPARHFFLKKAICDYAKRDERIHNVYYYDKNGTALYSVDFTGDGLLVVENLFLVMDRASADPYILYAAMSDTGKEIARCGEHIYNEEADRRRGRKPKGWKPAEEGGTNG